MTPETCCVNCCSPCPGSAPDLLVLGSFLLHAAPMQNMTRHGLAEMKEWLVCQSLGLLVLKNRSHVMENCYNMETAGTSASDLGVSKKMVYGHPKSPWIPSKSPSQWGTEDESHHHFCLTQPMSEPMSQPLGTATPQKMFPSWMSQRWSESVHPPTEKTQLSEAHPNLWPSQRKIASHRCSENTPNTIPSYSSSIPCWIIMFPSSNRHNLQKKKPVCRAPAPRCRWSETSGGFSRRALRICGCGLLLGVLGIDRIYGLYMVSIWIIYG